MPFVLSYVGMKMEQTVGRLSRLHFLNAYFSRHRCTIDLQIANFLISFSVFLTDICVQCHF